MEHIWLIHGYQWVPCARIPRAAFAAANIPPGCPPPGGPPPGGPPTRRTGVSLKRTIKKVITVEKIRGGPHKHMSPHQKSIPDPARGVNTSIILMGTGLLSPPSSPLSGSHWHRVRRSPVKSKPPQPINTVLSLVCTLIVPAWL